MNLVGAKSPIIYDPLKDSWAPLDHAGRVANCMDWQEYFKKWFDKYDKESTVTWGNLCTPNDDYKKDFRSSYDIGGNPRCIYVDGETNKDRISRCNNVYEEMCVFYQEMNGDKDKSKFLKQCQKVDVSSFQLNQALTAASPSMKQQIKAFTSALEESLEKSKGLSSLVSAVAEEVKAAAKLFVLKIIGSTAANIVTFGGSYLVNLIVKMYQVSKSIYEIVTKLWPELQKLSPTDPKYLKLISHLSYKCGYILMNSIAAFTGIFRRRLKKMRKQNNQLKISFY